MPDFVSIAVVLLTRLLFHYQVSKQRTKHATGTISKILLYPVKSCQAVQVPAANIDEHGLTCGGVLDRSFVVVGDGRLMDLKKCPALYKVRPRLDDGCQGRIWLTADGEPDVAVEVTMTIREFRMFGEQQSGRLCTTACSDWLRRVCQRDDLELVSAAGCNRSTLPELLECSRQGIASPNFQEFPGSADSRIAFANTAPLMLVSQSTLTEVDRRVREFGDPGVDVRNFRPNLVVDGEIAEGEEETWSFLYVNSCTLALLAPCTRCAITTVDPDTATLRRDQQPLKALKTYKQDGPFQRASPVLGVNGFVETPGAIAIGDQVYCS